MTTIADYFVTVVPLHLTVDPWWDNVEVLAFGTHCDMIDADRYVPIVEDRVALVLDEECEELIGFVVSGWSALEDLEQDDVDLWWGAPRFDVPVLGLSQASVGEILVAVRGRFAPDEPTADAMHFHLAMAAETPDEALPQWQLALEAGDVKALYGLGYTLCELGEYRRAYDYLRRYTELAPVNAWAWCWYGQACAGAGLREEARTAFERALALDEEETDAAEHLRALEA